MVNLTQPAVVCFRNEIPKDRDLYAFFIKVDSILKEYKRAFADEQLFRVLAECVEDLFDKPWEDRSDDDRLLIERILVLIRNVLHITPDVSTEHRTDEDVSVHDQLLWAIHLSGWDELLLFLANAEDEQSVFAFHTLEIISLMLREQTPEQLAVAGTSSTHNDPQSLIIERCHLREKEQRRAALVELNMRHNRFGGTFELLDTKSLSNRPLIYHHDVTAPVRKACPGSAPENTSDASAPTIGLVDLDFGKKMRRKPRTRKPLIEREFHRRSILSVQLYLRNFCWQFLRNCYNPLMSAARGAILRQNTQANDETYYLWAMRFFMAFGRLYRFRPQYLSESLSVSVFNWVYTLCMGYRESLFAYKRGGATNQNALQISRRLALAVSAYLQFLLCLQEMVKPSPESAASTDLDDEEKESVEDRENRLRAQKQAAESLMSNIFYVAEYQDLYVLLLREYNESIQSKEYLIDLVEGAHLFISLLTSQEKAAMTLIVSRRQRRRHANEKRRQERAERRRRQQEAAEARRKLRQRANESPEERAARLARTWGVLSTSLLTMLAANKDVVVDDDDLPQLFDPAAAPPDAASMAKQLRNAIRLVHTELHANRASRALLIARNMWDIWPEAAPSLDEANQDGEMDEDLLKEKQRAMEAGLEPAQVAEYTALWRIFLLDLADEQLEVIDASIREDEEKDEEEERNELIRRELGDSDDEYDVVDKEVAFDLNAYLLRFTHPHIIRSLIQLLANYALNPPSTNTCLLHLFHRIAIKPHIPGILFQLRLFSVIQTIIKDPILTKLDESKELLKFMKYVLRKFFEAFERNRSVAVEALFFKSTKEAAEVYSGYGTYETGHKAATWSTDLDRELGQLFEAYRYDPVPQGDDLVDVLKRNLSDPTKTRRQIITRLIFLGKVDSAKQLKMMTIHMGEGRRATRRARRPWTEDEVNMLQSLFLEHKGSSHLLSDIMGVLNLEYEDKLKQARAEGGEDDEPLLRTRQEVGRKLIELGLVSDASEFGKSRRRSSRKTAEEVSQLEVLDGGISVLKKQPRGKKARVRRTTRPDSSPELHFNTNERFSDEEEVPASGKGPSRSSYFDPDEDNDDYGEKDNDAEVPSSGKEPSRSKYFDPDEANDDGDVDSDVELSVSRRQLNRSTYFDPAEDSGSDEDNKLEIDNPGQSADSNRPTNPGSSSNSPPPLFSNTDAEDEVDDAPAVARKRRKLDLEDDDDDDDEAIEELEKLGASEPNIDFLQREIDSALQETGADVQIASPPHRERRRTRLLGSDDDDEEKGEKDNA
uniref:TIMELESS_C domain-containing protein n=3 Tax=Mesocestoides corti TaxID=53468 RepID=A0A5K3FGP2_MESCO